MQARAAPPSLARPRRLPGHGKPSTAVRSAAHSPAVKDHSYNHGAQRLARGGGARCPRAGRQPTPAPRPARVDVGCPPPRKGPETVVRQHRGLPRTPYTFAGGQKAVAVLLVRAARPGLDAGALRHYSTNACKEGGKTAENPWNEGHSRLHAGAATIRRAPVRGWRGERKGEHGQSAAAPVLTTVPLGGRIGAGKRRSCSSALPSRRGARTSPGCPAVRGGSPAATPYQPLHGPVRGRLRSQAYCCDRSCASLWWPGRRGGIARGGVPHGASVDDGGVGLRPAPPSDPAASASCMLVR